MIRIHAITTSSSTVRRSRRSTGTAPNRCCVPTISTNGGLSSRTILLQFPTRVRAFFCISGKIPGFHMGESLLPFSMQAFTRLGLHEKFARAGFMEKFGGEMYGACGDDGVKFYFEDGFRSQTDRSYQVTRADFDKVLLDHAAESGAEVREETGVDKVDFSEDGATLVISRKGNGGPEEIRARYVIDASGRNSILCAKFKLKKNYEHLQKVSVFAHYDGMIRAEGRDGTLTRMVRAIDRWFWVIPLSATRTSVGVVLDGAVFKKSGLNADEFLQQAIEEQPILMQQ